MWCNRAPEPLRLCITAISCDRFEMLSHEPPLCPLFPSTKYLCLMPNTPVIQVCSRATSLTITLKWSKRRGAIPLIGYFCGQLGSDPTHSGPLASDFPISHLSH